MSLFNESRKLQWRGHKKGVIKASRDVKEEEAGKASQAEGTPAQVPRAGNSREEHGDESGWSHRGEWGSDGM